MNKALSRINKAIPGIQHGLDGLNKGIIKMQQALAKQDKAIADMTLAYDKLQNIKSTPDNSQPTPPINNNNAQPPTMNKETLNTKFSKAKTNKLN